MDEIDKILEEKIQILKDLNFLKVEDNAKLATGRFIGHDLVESRFANKTEDKTIPNGEVIYPVLINGNPEYELRVEEDPTNGKIKFLSIMKTKNVIEKQKYLEGIMSSGRIGDVKLLELPYLQTSFIMDETEAGTVFYRSSEIDLSDNILNTGNPLIINDLNNLIQKFKEDN